MKKLFLILLCLTALLSYGAPVITAVINNGDWATSTTWDLNRVPQTGDTVLIPSGKTVILTLNQVISGFVYMKVYGTLKLNTGILDLGSTSIIMVYTGGKITGNGCSCEQIRIGNVKKYKAGPDVLGPQYASSSTIGFQPIISVLPVKFLGFTLTKADNAVLVQWTTAEEINAAYFQVERSVDGASWSAIASVTATGNSNTQINYSFTDKNIITPVVYYRIKEVDHDGSFTISVIRSLKTDSNKNAVQITSSPNQVMLQFNSTLSGKVMVQWINTGGQVMDQQVISHPSGQVILNSKFRGACIVAVSNGQSFYTARQIIL